MELTEKEINIYIEYIINSYQAHEEIKWMIEHLDDDALSTIKNLIDNEEMIKV